MISHSDEFLSASELCARVKHLGYATSEDLRLYGGGFQYSCTADSRDCALRRQKTESSLRGTVQGRMIRVAFSLSVSLQEVTVCSDEFRC